MKGTKTILTIVGVIVAIFVIFIASRRKLGILWDPISERRLLTLHPAIRKVVRKFINKAEDEGIFLRITDAFRSFEEQAKLPSSVTNAGPGQSYHNYGLAIDVVEMKDGGPLWVNPRWERIGQIGKSFGFEWGGDWTSIVDQGHFQKTFGLKTKELLARLNNGDTSGNFVNVA